MNYKGKIHKFDKKLFKKYDIPARNKIKECLYPYIYDNPDIYGADMIIKSEKNIKYKYLELQVCTCWINEKFPFEKLYIWERKKKYNNDTLFITFNKDLSMGYLFDLSKVDKDKPRRIKKYSREFIYDIPWNQTMLIYTDTLTSDIIDEF
jgi:hypothetical protein